jgi:hypothetical protein
MPTESKFDTAIPKSGEPDAAPIVVADEIELSEADLDKVTGGDESPKEELKYRG